MKVTLITVCRNVAPVIRETLESILVQTHAEIELIVIDGASTDGTVEILREYADPPQGLPTQEGTVRNTSTSGSLAGYPGEVKDRRGITTLVSEPDKGIYDAMNKGLRLATGEVIGFVNAGDLLMTPTVIADVVNAFQRAHVDAVYGDIIMVDEHDIHKVHRTWLSGTYHRNNFRKGWMPPHVGTFIRKGVYDRHGHFNTDLRIGADSVRGAHHPYPVRTGAVPIGGHEQWERSSHPECQSRGSGILGHQRPASTSVACYAQALEQSDAVLPLNEKSGSHPLLRSSPHRSFDARIFHPSTMGRSNPTLGYLHERSVTSIDC